jgi:murein DD-endopeptidase MepM/ murein hydrolase activator NlpD
MALALPSHAGAASSGGATPIPPPAPAPKPPRPTINDIRCVAGPGGCIEEHRVSTGGTISIKGRDLAAASAVVLYGRKGGKDDVTVPVSATGPTWANAAVPDNGRSGPIGVLTANGPRSVRWRGLVIENPTGELRPYKLAAVPAQVEATLSQPRRISVGGMHKSVFSYEIAGNQPVDVQVNLVRQSDGSVVRSWNQGRVSPGTLQRVAWDGKGSGKTLPEGRYFFQVVTPGSTPGASAQAVKASSGDSVALTNYAFPLRGTFSFGTSINRFGAGRGGRSHGGHDLMSPCGTPIVAARGGKVIYSGYGGAAGNYVAISGLNGDYDYAYMHLREHALVNTGDRVYTGQPLGYVGNTGNSTACHLHFEIWTQPGWYKGGHAIDPLPSLKRWKRAEKAKG